jgi:hypothetical protein
MCRYILSDFQIAERRYVDHNLELKKTDKKDNFVELHLTNVSSWILSTMIYPGLT